MTDEELALQFTLGAHNHFDSIGNDHPTKQAVDEQINALTQTYISTLQKVKGNPVLNPPKVGYVSK